MSSSQSKKIICTNTMVIGIVISVVCLIGIIATLLFGKPDVKLFVATIITGIGMIVAAASYIELKKLKN